MPNMDGTGPRGQGAGTGRGLGPCGAGKRMGFGRDEDRIAKLEKEIKALKDKLE